MAMEKNDARIMLLKEQIAEKRNLLKNKNSRFVPITNCLLELDGIKYNLHLDSSLMLMAKLYSLKMAAEELSQKYPDISFNNIYISGYSIDNWIDDIKLSLEIQAYKNEKRKLDKLEKELTNLLSDDKQTELKIDELENLLKN